MSPKTSDQISVSHTLVARDVTQSSSSRKRTERFVASAVRRRRAERDDGRALSCGIWLKIFLQWRLADRPWKFAWSETHLTPRGGLDAAW